MRLKLLFDQNLSFKLCQFVADLFPNSSHVRGLGMSEAVDQVIWNFAKANGFAIVSQDVDFAEMAALLGSPPKVILLRVGNQSTAAVSSLLQRRADVIVAFGSDHTMTCLEIY